MINSSTSDLMTTAEVAEALRRSVKTVTRMVSSGALVPVKRLPGPRGAFLFDPAHVEAILSREPWEPSK